MILDKVLGAIGNIPKEIKNYYWGYFDDSNVLTVVY